MKKRTLIDFMKKVISIIPIFGGIISVILGFPILRAMICIIGKIEDCFSFIPYLSILPSELLWENLFIIKAFIFLSLFSVILGMISLKFRVINRKLISIGIIFSLIALFSWFFAWFLYLGFSYTQ
jgi:hypothetical protein